VSTSGGIIKRLLVERAMHSHRPGQRLLLKPTAPSVFARRALSSGAYASEEIFITLVLAGGIFATTCSWQIGFAVVLVMLVVVASCRQNVHAYPCEGGDHEAGTDHLGPVAGPTVASVLLVDYVPNAAVSPSSGAGSATGSVVDRVRSARRASPRDVVMFHIPQYVVGSWYEHLLHSQTAMPLTSQGAQQRLKGVDEHFEAVHECVDGEDPRLQGAGASSVGRGQ
jgi:hypothetical protein